MTASLTKVAIFIIFSLSEKLDLRMVGTAFANLGIWPGGGRRILRVSVREIKKEEKYRLSLRAWWRI